MTMLTSVYVVIFVAFCFDFINGFHDAANSIATLVATGVLTPVWAVWWAAFFNGIALCFFSLNVATTLGTGLVVASDVNTAVIFAALMGAIIFGLLTWWLALPSSSSQALIGGLIGAVVFNSGWHGLQLSGLTKVVIAIFISPPLGVVISWWLLWLLEKYGVEKPMSIRFQKGAQLVAAAFLSIGHGANDAQKSMGIIALLLFSAHLLGPVFYVPWWVMISCIGFMSFGTLLGGWRIVRTLGEKITPLTLASGTAAEAASATVLFAATYLGVPVSTTHIVTGSITGVGLYRRVSAVNWSMVKRIVWGWLLTIPATALLAAGTMGVQGFF